MGRLSGQGGRTSPHAIQARERENKALALRLAGASYPAIAKEVGYAEKGAAYRAVSRAMDRLPKENAQQCKDQSLAQLDRVILTQNEIIEANKPFVCAYDDDGRPKGGSEAKSRIVDRATARLMQAIAAKCRLEGLLKPAPIELHTDGGPVGIVNATVNLEDVLAIAAENARPVITTTGEAA